MNPIFRNPPFILLTVILLLASCVSKEKYEQVVQQKNVVENEKNTLAQKYQRLNGEYDNMKTSYHRAMTMLNKAEDYLSRIEQRHREIDEISANLDAGDFQSDEFQRMRKLRIENSGDLNEADNLIKRLQVVGVDYEMFKEAIEKLARRLKEKEEEIRTLKATIEDLEKTNRILMAQVDTNISAYTERIASLEINNRDLGEENQQLLDKNEQVTAENLIFFRKNDSLIRQSDSLSATLATMQEEMTFMDNCNIVYTVYGEQKKLQEMGIINKKNDLAEGYLDHLDIFGTRDIADLEDSRDFEYPSNVKSILPLRSSDTYTINKNRIYVANPNQFWRTSKFLVVVLK